MLSGCSPSSSLAMPTYLHYKLVIGRKKQLYYANRCVSEAHEFDSAHVKFDA